MEILSPEFQKSTLRLMLQDASFLKRYRGIIDTNLFKDETDSEIVGCVLSFYDKYGSTPSHKSFELYLERVGYDITDSEEYLEQVFTEKVPNASFVEDSLKEFIRTTRLHDAMREGVELLKNKQYDALVDKIKKAAVSVGDGELGRNLLDDTRRVLDSLDIKEVFIPTGLSRLDEKMGGGAVRGTLNVVITPPNRGKSTTLVNFGKNALLRGYNVAHYSFELSDIVIERRYFMSMAKMSKNEMKAKKATAYDRICSAAQGVMDAHVTVKNYPAHAVTTSAIREHLSMMKDTKGFFPDVIVVDYADLLKATHSFDEKRHELAAIYYELRNIAIETNAVMWTASQTNRSGTDEELITDTDLAECYEKAGAADVLLSINQSLDEKRGRPQTARLFLIKNRDDESQVLIEIATDWARAWIGDL